MKTDSKKVSIITPALYTDGEDYTYIERFNTIDEAKAKKSKNGGVIFDYYKIEELYREAKIEEWGWLGGYNLHLALNTKTGEVSSSTCDKNSFLRYKEPWVCINDVIVDAGEGLELTLNNDHLEYLNESYWSEVRDSLDARLEQEKLELTEDEITEMFEREDGDDGKGGSPLPATLAEWMLERWKQKLAEENE